MRTVVVNVLLGVITFSIVTGGSFVFRHQIVALFHLANTRVLACLVVIVMLLIYSFGGILQWVLRKRSINKH